MESRGPCIWNCQPPGIGDHRQSDDFNPAEDVKQQWSSMLVPVIERVHDNPGSKRIIQWKMTVMPLLLLNDAEYEDDDDDDGDDEYDDDDDDDE